jgi:ArsR family transcriptional regulator
MATPNVAETAAKLMQALAHPVRLQILELLRDEGAYVMHLTVALNRRQAYLSQHLAILREAGLVVDERRGMTVIYRVSDRRIFDLLDHLRKVIPLLGMLDRRQSALASFWPRGSLPRTFGGCRCPRCRGLE